MSRFFSTDLLGCSIGGGLINDLLTSGEWIAKDEPLLTVGQFDAYQIEAFLAVDHLGQIQPGARADFYPEQLDWPSIPCRIVRIDNAAATQLPPVFTSRYQGSIAIRGNNKDVSRCSKVF